MLALTVQPGTAGSAALEQVSEPTPEQGEVLVEALAIGVCGTDVEIVEGKYGWAPKNESRLILGHESLGRVLNAPAASGLSAGDLVVGIVRRPDPVPCPNCEVGEWDMCRNGLYTERGIKELHGFCSERFRLEVEYAVKVESSLGDLGVLLEPASVLAKAWEHIDHIGARARWQPERVLVTGAGPIGLLAALMARQRGLEVDVLDRITTGPKPQLVHDLGARYHTTSVAEIASHPNIVLECTGVPKLVFDVMNDTTPGGIVCLAGVSSGNRKIEVDFGSLSTSMVLENDVVFGSVNANRRHYEKAAQSLAQADPDWLNRLITRRVPLSQWQSALYRQEDDVKVVIGFDR